MPVDLSRQVYTTYQQAMTRARLHLDQGAHLEAAAAYRQAAAYMKQYAQYAADTQIKGRRLEQAQSLLDLADKVEAGRLAVPTAEPPAGADDYSDAIAALVHKSPVTWADIGGLAETKREIKAAYGLSMARKPVGVRLRGWRNILFYGPPGTGKTLLAAATSNGLDATFFNVKVSDLLSKYFGESTKLVSALYQAARRMAPAVVFLDEFESLSGARGDGDSGAERRIVTTFLAELDGLAGKGDDEYVLTIAATNVPWLLDKAMLSRFEKKVYIPLPDEPARQAILRIQLDAAGYQTRVSYAELTRRTAGFSGRELQRLCQEAITHMVTTTNPGLVAAVDEGREALERYQVRVRPLTDADFAMALERVSPETTAADLRRFDQWRANQE